jgi:DNA-binding MarR family transcriptional regulator
VVTTESQRRAVAEGLDRLIIWARRKTPPVMSATAITTMDTLAYAGPLRISELAEHEGVSQPGMTTLVNRLAASGHAERIPDPTDGRATLVRITSAGRKLLADRAALRADALLDDLAALPAQHQAALVAALDAIDELTRQSGHHPIGNGTTPR